MDFDLGFAHSCGAIREEHNDESKIRKVVKANNFTQQTNALDVDKHMFVMLFHPASTSMPRFDKFYRIAYIEENMKMRHKSRVGSVDDDGKQHYLDATIAYRQAVLRCIEYLRRFGYNDYQSYLMMSCIPLQGHIAGIVDVGYKA